MARHKIDIITAHQADKELYCFSMKAKDLYQIVDINKRKPDADEGYQRILSASRVQTIAKYIDSDRVIPTCILVSLESPATLSQDHKSISFPADTKIGWVIDGQHRLAGAKEAVKDIDFFVVCFLNLPIEEQIRQFMTINNESKGVPTSLIYDLLSYMPADKTPSDVAKEQSSEIAKILSRDESSPFFGRIAILNIAKKGEISLTNFVRKIYPLIVRDKGKFGRYSWDEQKKIIENYYKALMHIYPDQSDPSTSVFFQTIGFGAAFNVIDFVFDYCIKLYQGFAVTDIIKLLKNVEDFDLNVWKQYGTGSAAEIQAAKDFKVALEMRLADNQSDGQGRIRLS